MEERSDAEKMEEVMLPGFRFHPTDEELVGFYLKRKVQQRSLSIELIKQLDIYKYDPWDLPKLATTGEKEWYFYCPRDRKYRNSARPNRVTGAGFWKATGTDRPIYSSEGNKCIGLKKSLVFYKGRAAKGIKTDWMMHEFRLPSLTDSLPHKRCLDKSIPANESWAICRIFKKTNSTSQRAVSHSWVSPLPEPTTSGHTPPNNSPNTQFISSDNISLTTKPYSSLHFNPNNDIQNPSSASSTTTFSPLDFISCKPINPTAAKPPQVPVSNSRDISGFLFSPIETSSGLSVKSTVDVSSMLLNMSSSMFGDYGMINKATDSLDFGGYSQDQCNNNCFSTSLPHHMQGNEIDGDDQSTLIKNLNAAALNEQWENVRSMGFPFSLPMSTVGDHAWKQNMVLDSNSCPSEMFTSFNSTHCYT